jgi:hypothetical protein
MKNMLNNFVGNFSVLRKMKPNLSKKMKMIKYCSYIVTTNEDDNGENQWYLKTTEEVNMH